MNSILQKTQKIHGHIRHKKWLSIACTKFSNQEIVDMPDNPSITIPTYSGPPGETMEKQRARLVYQSRKRGILENDLLLSTFAAKHLNQLNKTQLDEYDKLINTAKHDWDIYYWITGKSDPPKEFDHSVMKLIQQHVRNCEHELRIKQPHLHVD